MRVASSSGQRQSGDGRAWRAWRWAVPVARRGWWVGVLVAALVLLGAGAQYVRAVRAAPFVASQTLRIALLEPPAASTSAVTAADANAASIARQLASGGLLASPRLDAAIAARMRADDPALPGVTPGAAAAGISAVHGSDGLVTLRARWPSAKGAQILLRATIEVLRGGALAEDPAVAALAAPGPPGAALQVYAVGGPGAPAPDAGALAAARGDLLARAGLGVLAGLLAALAGGMLLARRSVAVVPSERASGE